MSATGLIVGLGAALLDLTVVACPGCRVGMTHTLRQVNHRSVTLLVSVLIVAVLSFFDVPTSLIVFIVALAIAVIVRDAARFVRHAVYGVTKYSRRDYWYRRVGHPISRGRGWTRR